MLYSRRSLVAAVLTFVSLIDPAIANAADTPQPDPAAIRASIEKAKAYLYSRQVDGLWDHTDAAKGNLTPRGFSAIALYALLAAGEDPNDARIKPSLDRVFEVETNNIYELGIRAQLYNHVPMNKERSAWRMRDVKALADAMGTKMPELGLFAYNVRPSTQRPDMFYHMSTSNYGLLGCWASGRLPKVGSISRASSGRFRTRRGVRRNAATAGGRMRRCPRRRRRSSRATTPA